MSRYRGVLLEDRRKRLRLGPYRLSRKVENVSGPWHCPPIGKFCRSFGGHVGVSCWELTVLRAPNLENTTRRRTNEVRTPGLAAPADHCTRAANPTCTGHNGRSNGVQHTRVSPWSRIFPQGELKTSARPRFFIFVACTSSTMGPMVVVPQTVEPPQPCDSSERG